MSHLTCIKISIRELSTLQRALTQLSLDWEKSNITVKIPQTQDKTANVDLIIHQTNNFDIGFIFNGEEYILLIDKSFWALPWSVELFLDKVNQVYALNLLNEELTKIGFTTCNGNVEKTTEGNIDFVSEKWLN
jgi:hypothetical protein